MKDYTLEQALTISDENTIFEVLGKMELFEEIAANDPILSRVLPFHHTYFLVTKSVVSRTYNSKGFVNEEAIQKLDVHFAKKYFDPLKNFVLHKKVSAPWSSFFSLIEDKHYEPFTCLFAGINAHINGDLASSIIETNYLDNRKDFLLINKMLREEIPIVLRFVALNRLDLFGMAAMALHELAEKEFEKVIVKWRSDAWENALKINSGEITLQKVHAKTVEIGGEINSLVHFKNGILLPSFLPKIENLSCKIE